MNYQFPAALVFLVPVAAAVLFYMGGLHFFEKSLNTDRLRDILASMAYTIAGSFALIMIALLSWWAYTQLV